MDIISQRELNRLESNVLAIVLSTVKCGVLMTVTLKAQFSGICHCVISHV